MSTLAVRSAIVASGFTTLGIQVITPRLLHPFFGSGSNVAAAVVAMGLAGLAIGYRLGGRSTSAPIGAMSLVAAIAASLLTVEGILLRFDLARSAVVDTLWLLPTVGLLVGVPSLFLGMLSPLAIQALGDGHDETGRAAATTGTSAAVFSLGTAANVVGGLASGFVLVPFVGISSSLIGVGVVLAASAVLLRLAGDTQPVGAGRSGERAQQAEDGAGVLVRSRGSGADSRLVYGYLALAAYSGVASVALEVNASRMLASYFGPTTGLWAAILSVSLGGLALGYRLGGLLPLPALPRALPSVVALNAAWLLAATWFISLASPQAGLPFVQLVFVAALAFGPPFVLFGIESQILVGAVWAERGSGSMSASAASVFAVSSVGGVAGALLGITYLIPLLGLSGLVRLFVAGYLVVLAATWSTWRMVSAAIALVAVLLPLPDWIWRGVPGRLVVQEEGRFQTIRVYTDDRTYLRFHLGPTYESEMVLQTREPRFGYSRLILDLVGDVAGERVLIIGGAGHALGHAFETRGATVTEVELDPIVKRVSDEHFGPLDGESLVEDGRRYVTRSPAEAFDVVVIDAFAGPRYVPPHLTTEEFFTEVERVLGPEATMYMNIISAVDGADAGPFEAISSSVAAPFQSSGYLRSRGNVLLIGSKGGLPPAAIPIEPARSPSTDDRNPIDILLEFAR